MANYAMREEVVAFVKGTLDGVEGPTTAQTLAVAVINAGVILGLNADFEIAEIHSMVDAMITQLKIELAKGGRHS